MLYCAHAIFYFKLTEANQDSFLVHENVYLIDAADEDQALISAIQLAKEREDRSEDGHLELNEEKAAYVFGGIRKLIEVETAPHAANTAGLAGLELTYSEFEVDTIEQVQALADGDMVETLYRE